MQSCHVKGAAGNACICFADAPQIAVSAAKLAQLQYEMVPLENSGVDCRADIPDLEPGLDYLLRVSAVNAQGPSPASEPGWVPSHLARPTGCVLQHTPTVSCVCCSIAAEGWLTISSLLVDRWLTCKEVLISKWVYDGEVIRGFWLTVVFCAQHASAQRRRRLLHRSLPMLQCPRPPTPCSWSGRSRGAAERPSPATLSRWRPQMLCSRCRGRPHLRR